MAVLNLVNDDGGSKCDTILVRPSSSRVEPTRLTTLVQDFLTGYTFLSTSSNLIPLYTFRLKPTFFLVLTQLPNYTKTNLCKAKLHPPLAGFNQLHHSACL